MTDSAKVVIIGAGIVGCSTAYHLSLLGWSDVLVLEQGPLFGQDNSTSHAPGIIFQTNHSRTMTKFAQHSVDLFSRLRLDGRPCYYPVGGMEVSYSDERQQELKRKLGSAMSWGVDARLISPEEAKKMVPMMDETRIKGAFYVPMDGVVKAVRACEAMAKEAQAKGIRFQGDAEVVGIDVENGTIRGVKTVNGRIDADIVLLCAGIWGPKVARTAGVTLPLSPVEHLYAKTAPLPELKGAEREIDQPVVRHQDRAMYFRQDLDAYCIGSYQHAPLLFDADKIPVRGDGTDAPSIRKFTPEHFRIAQRSAGELFPPLKKASLQYAINGMFSFTIDGMPILGPQRDVEGLWIAEGVWITHSGGVGKVMAEWIDNGVPSLDLRECDVNRFHSYAYSPSYIRSRVAQQYREVYDIIHPSQSLTHPRNLRVSPFQSRLEALGAVFAENVGWERPRWFEANRGLLEGDTSPVRSGWEARYWSPIQGAEHHRTRRAVALYDMTPFTKIAVEGTGALEYLEELCSNRINQSVGRIVYTSMLDEKAGIVCDLTVTRLGEESFLVITGASTGMRDLAWLSHHLPRDGRVRLTDVTSQVCCLGLWGPRAPELLQKVCEEDTASSRFRPFTARRIFVGDVPVLALQVSYVGESGWELYAETSYGPKLWDLLWAAGREFGLIAAGGAAFDSLRLEKGFRLCGSDIHTEYNPIEAGLEFAVKFDKGSFIGRDALLVLRDKGTNRRLSRMYFDQPGSVVMGKEPILYDDKVVGYVTSSNYGYTLGKGIAYGYLPVGLSHHGTKVKIYYLGETYSASVVDEPGSD